MSNTPQIIHQNLACDCHVHIFNSANFPYDKARTYTPNTAKTEDLVRMHQSLAIQRSVLVQPSVYASDNDCLIASIRELGQYRARGIAVVNLQTVSDFQLQQLHADGVRGIRLNLHVNGDHLENVRQQIKQAKRLQSLPHWHVQIYTSIHTHAALLDDYAELGIPVVMDHFAGALSSNVQDDLHLQQVLAAMQRTPLYVKLSAAYRLPSQVDADVLARLFYTAASDQVVWGSDWPHTGGSGDRNVEGVGRKPDEIEPFRKINNHEALQAVLSAIPDEHAAQKILINTPAHLYDFL